MIGFFFSIAKMCICLLGAAYFAFKLYVEYFDCAFLAGFTFLSLRYGFGLEAWLSANVLIGLSLAAALIVGIAFFAIYKTKIGFQVLRLGFTLFWGYLFFNLFKYLFNPQNIVWCWAFAIFMTYKSFISHYSLEEKARYDRELEEEALAKEQSKSHW